MKKRTALFLVFLFACTFAFSFGLAQNAHANECCILDGGPNCTDGVGTYDKDLSLCYLDPSKPNCYIAPICW